MRVCKYLYEVYVCACVQPSQTPSGQGWLTILALNPRLAHNSCTQFIKQQYIIAHQSYLFVICMLF